MEPNMEEILLDPMASFKECFAKGKWEGSHLLSEDLEDPSKDIYYSLEHVSDGWFATFTFNLYRRDRPDIRKAIDAAFAGAKRQRMYVKGSRYSADYWRCRNPITKIDELMHDFESLKNIVDPILNGSALAHESKVLYSEDGLKHEWPSMALPACLTLNEISQRIKDENIVLPAVQRGKVWNAARCATLWDSIMRGYSIGSLSVQKDNGHYNLLDGQQRTTAILLGDIDVPPKEVDRKEECPYNSILWIDLTPKTQDECKFHFYVTTASQPWGYERTTDETKNERLRFFEVREMLMSGISWHMQAEKPYPSELWPKRATFPVPFKLLREYLSLRKDVSIQNGVGIKDFIDWCKKCKDSRQAVEKTLQYSWNWLDHADKNQEIDNSSWDNIVEAVHNLENYSLLIQDVGRVAEDDVSLYFTRIGKGGVVPSNEELAYSVLKARLGDGGDSFRAGVEKVVEEIGLDRGSRVASMVVRYFISIAAESSHVSPKLYTGDILSRVIEDSRDEKPWLKEMEAFVRLKQNGSEWTSPLMEFCRTINSRLMDEGYTSWHITRYCQRHSGVVYQFLMMVMKYANQDPAKSVINCGLTLGGLAELLCWYAPDPAYVIRKIISNQNIAEGIIEAINETYYGSARMTLPLCPNAIDPIMKAISADDVAKIEGAKVNCPDVVNLGCSAKSGTGIAGVRTFLHPDAA